LLWLEFGLQAFVFGAVSLLDISPMGNAAVARFNVVWADAVVAPIIVAQFAAGTIMEAAVTDEVVNFPALVSAQLVA
jgi:hypothetical protein